MNCSEIISKPCTVKSEMAFEISKSLTVLLSVIPIIAVFGNGLVFLAVYKNKTLQTITNILIVSLAVADFLVAVCVMPFALYFQFNALEWNLGPVVCNLYMAVDVAGSTASILNLFAISLDRYIAVVYPFSYAEYRANRRGHTKLVVALVWAVSILVGLPIIIGINKNSSANNLCEFTNAYFIIISSLFSFFLPGVAIIFLYAVILKKLKDKVKNRQSPASDSIKIDNLSQSYTGERRFAIVPATISNFETDYEVSTANFHNDGTEGCHQLIERLDVNKILLNRETLSLPITCSSSEQSTIASMSTCETFANNIDFSRFQREKRYLFSRQDSLKSIMRQVAKGWKTAGSNMRAFNPSRQVRHEQKATVTLAVVLAVFLICWIPFFTLHLTNALCLLDQGDSCVHFQAFFFATWLGYLNSSVNPLIYTVFDQRFRRAFKKLLGC